MKKSTLFVVFGAVIALSGFFLEAQTAEQAMVLEQQGNLEQAAQAWKAVTERNPSDAAVTQSVEEHCTDVYGL